MPNLRASWRIAVTNSNQLVFPTKRQTRQATKSHMNEQRKPEFQYMFDTMHNISPYHQKNLRLWCLCLQQGKIHWSRSWNNRTVLSQTLTKMLRTKHRPQNSFDAWWSDTTKWNHLVFKICRTPNKNLPGVKWMRPDQNKLPHACEKTMNTHKNRAGRTTKTSLSNQSWWNEHWKNAKTNTWKNKFEP